MNKGKVFSKVDVKEAFWHVKLDAESSLLTTMIAILEMPAPTGIHGVKRFCGMIQYLARFMPDLTGYLAPLRKLTR